MLKFDQNVLDQFTDDFFSDLDILISRKIQDEPEYPQIVSRIEHIKKKHIIIAYLTDGSEKAAGHTLSKDEVSALEEYWMLRTELDELIYRLYFRYGVVLGSGLSSIDPMKDGIIKIKSKN